MTIRLACPDDVPHIESLLSHAAVRGALLPQSGRSIAAGLERWVVGVDECDGVVGCVALDAHRSDLAEIRSLAVSSRMRGRGLASALLRSAISLAWKRGFTSVFAHTHAVGLFGRVGFRPMDDAGARRPLCGRQLRAGYQRVRIEAPQSLLDEPSVTAGLLAAVVQVDAALQPPAATEQTAGVPGAPAQSAYHRAGAAPPGFHFHRWRKVGCARPCLAA